MAQFLIHKNFNVSEIPKTSEFCSFMITNARNSDISEF